MDTNSALDTLKNLLGDNAEEKIQAAVSSLGLPTKENDERAEKSNLPASVNSDNKLDYAMKIKGLIDELGTADNDSRSRLLLSLRPFMRAERQQSIDSAIKLLNITRLTALIKP